MLRRATVIAPAMSSSSSRGGGTTAAAAVALTATSAITPQLTSSPRTYMSWQDPLWSLWCCTWVTCAGAAWGNNFHSITKYGLYRHNMLIDNPIMVEGSRVGQFIGGVCGFLFYWYIVGPMKYWKTDMGKWAKRFGNAPF